ncbi:MAG: hypothetical protein LBR44_06150 [Clostridiales Family XIII bacterium]|jgi:hypothetical protein|nr:hypothetical protein [Clostridiales Family XIII bacterium]
MIARLARAARRRPRLTLALCAAFAAAAIVLETTFAWFTGKDSVTNPLRVPQLPFHVSVVDEFARPPAPPAPGGAWIPKRVGAANDGELRAVVRVLALPMVTAADGETVLPARLGAEVEADMDSARWADGGDGYYYWLGVLAPGEATDDLFTQVRLAAGLDDRYKGARLVIEVKAEASWASVGDYRTGWWGSDAVPGNGTLAQIDGVLSAMVQSP